MPDIIHPDYPFTADLKAELAATDGEGEPDSEGWSSSPRVFLVGEFQPIVHLAADIHADNSLLSTTAHELILEQWTTRLTPAEADDRLAQLDRLGSSWQRKRETFRQLLNSRAAVAHGH